MDSFYVFFDGFTDDKLVDSFLDKSPEYDDVNLLDVEYMDRYVIDGVIRSVGLEFSIDIVSGVGNDIFSEVEIGDDGEFGSEVGSRDGRILVKMSKVK